MPDEPKNDPVAQPQPAAPTGDAITAVISQRDTAIEKVKAGYEGKVSEAEASRDAALAQLKRYQEQDEAKAKDLYDGLDEEQKELADAVRESMDTTGLLNYLKLLAKKAKPQADDSNEPAPSFNRGEGGDDVAGDEVPAGRYKVQFPEEIERRTGIRPQHMQNARVLKDNSGMRVQVPLRQFKELIRVVEPQRLVDKG